MQLIANQVFLPRKQADIFVQLSKNSQICLKNIRFKTSIVRLN